MATAIKNAYAGLSAVNEYFYELNDKDLVSLIVQVTGLEQKNAIVKLTQSTLKILKSFANFAPDDGAAGGTDTSIPATSQKNLSANNETSTKQQLGLNLSYTINLNLPASSDQAVFNAIFRALKEHLLQNAD